MSKGVAVTGQGGHQSAVSLSGQDGQAITGGPRRLEPQPGIDRERLVDDHVRRGAPLGSLLGDSHRVVMATEEGVDGGTGQIQAGVEKPGQDRRPLRVRQCPRCAFLVADGCLLYTSDAADE